MQIKRLTNSSTQPLYQLKAISYDQMQYLESRTLEQLLELVEPFNFGGQVKQWHEDSVTIQVFID